MRELQTPPTSELDAPEMQQALQAALSQPELQRVLLAEVIQAAQSDKKLRKVLAEEAVQLDILQRLNPNAAGLDIGAAEMGVVQYYRLAYNLHRLGQLKWMMETSLTRTLAQKLKTSRAEIYRRYRAHLQTEQGAYTVLQVTIDRGPDKPSLTAHFGGVPLRWNQWVKISEETEPIWSKRSEVVERLMAQKCELCGSTLNVEVHHVRKLADLERGERNKPEWARVMAARRRKTLVVCQSCHNQIHAGRYDGPAFSKEGRVRAV